MANTVIWEGTQVRNLISTANAPIQRVDFFSADRPVGKQFFAPNCHVCAVMK
jgi:hypothetical protein